MNLTKLELKNNIDQLTAQLNSSVYVTTVIDNHPKQFSHVCWSKDVGYSFLPLGHEMVGFRGARYTNKKPTSLSYLYEYHLIDDTILKVVGHNKSGQHDSTAYIFNESDAAFKLEVDVDNNGVQLTKILYKNHLPVSALKVNDDNCYWYYEYIYINGKIKEICYNAYNSSEGLIYIDYIDNTVKEIYHLHHGTRVKRYKM